MNALNHGKSLFIVVSDVRALIHTSLQLRYKLKKSQWKITEMFKAILHFHYVIFDGLQMVSIQNEPFKPF